MYKILFDFDNDLQARALEYFCVAIFGKSRVEDEWFDSPDTLSTPDFPRNSVKNDASGGDCDEKNLY